MPRKLNDHDREKLDEFDTTTVHDAIGSWDRIRALVSDDGLGSPPREWLFGLHKKMFSVINEGGGSSELAEAQQLVWELEDILYDIDEEAKRITRVLNNLQKLMPDDDEWYDED